jgi:hypothetical protein
MSVTTQPAGIVILMCACAARGATTQTSAPTNAKPSRLHHRGADDPELALTTTTWGTRMTPSDFNRFRIRREIRESKADRAGGLLPARAPDLACRKMDAPMRASMRWRAAWAAILVTAACDGTVPAGRPGGGGPLDAGGDASAGTDGRGGVEGAGPTACALGPGAFCLIDPPYAGVWAIARDDVWLIESDFQEVTARHFDGSGWTTFPAGTSPLAAVWGSGRNDVWGVGAAATIVHFDGAAWSPISAPAAAGLDLTAVWGSGPTDVWAVGGPTGAGATLHWNGTAWSRVACCGAGAPEGGGLTLAAVSGSGPADVWAVGATVDGATGAASPAAIHWDGASWTAAPVPGSGFALTSVWSDGGGDVWFGAPQQIVRRAGGTFTSTPIVGTVTGLWGSGAGDLWATTKAGGTVHWNGAAWTEVASGTTNTLVAISGSATDDAWAVGPAGTVLRWDGASWTPLTDGTTGTLGAVWGDSADDVWTSGPLRWNGAGWAHDAGGSALAATGLCGFSAHDVWAVGTTLSAGDGNGFIAHWDGSLWTIDGIENIYAPVSNAAPNLGPSSMNAIWCHTPSDVWAVGLISVLTGQVADTVAHWDGTVWSPATPTMAFLSGVWGSAADDVWAAGVGGTLLHWNGVAWTALPSGTTDDLGEIWGSGADDVWIAVARQPQLLHWDGAAWTLVPSGGAAGLTAIWGSGADDVWAVGGDASSGEVLHFGGAFWSTVWSAPAAVGKLTGVWGSGGVLYVVAANGMVFARNP